MMPHPLTEKYCTVSSQEGMVSVNSPKESELLVLEFHTKGAGELCTSLDEN